MIFLKKKKEKKIYDQFGFSIFLRS